MLLMDVKMEIISASEKWIHLCNQNGLALHMATINLLMFQEKTTIPNPEKYHSNGQQINGENGLEPPTQASNLHF